MPVSPNTQTGRQTDSQEDRLIEISKAADVFDDESRFESDSGDAINSQSKSRTVLVKIRWHQCFFIGPITHELESKAEFVIIL